MAWSTFITGQDPDEHGIDDFVERDPVTHAPFSSMASTKGPEFVLPLVLIYFLFRAERSILCGRENLLANASRAWCAGERAENAH